MDGAFIKGRGNQVDGEKSSGSSHQANPATKFVDDVGADDRADNADRVQAAGETVLLQGAVPGLLEQYWRVSGHSSDAGPRSHNLQPETEPSTSSKVGTFAFATTDQDLGELDWGARRAVCCNGADLKILILDGFCVGPTDVDEDISGSLEVANGSVVARRVWEHLDAGQQQQGRNALEPQQEAPPDDGVTVVDEGKSEG